jgi:hypothetical protein
METFMQAYKTYPLLAFSLWLLGSNTYAEWCCPDEARCRFSKASESDHVVGSLKGGALYEWSNSFAYVGCYPTRLNDGGTYELSGIECEKEFPACKRDHPTDPYKCYVARDNGYNSCPTPPSNYCDAYIEACVSNGCDGLQKMPNVPYNVINDCKNGVYEARSKDRNNCREFIEVYVQTNWIKCDKPL